MVISAVYSVSSYADASFVILFLKAFSSMFEVIVITTQMAVPTVLLHVFSLGQAPVNFDPSLLAPQIENPLGKGGWGLVDGRASVIDLITSAH